MAAAASAELGEFERAAELAGARDALREQIGVLLPPVHAAGYERPLQAARGGLTTPEFDAAHSRSAGLPPPQIVAAAFRGLSAAQP